MATALVAAGVVRWLRTRAADGLVVGGTPLGWLRRLPLRYWRGMVILGALYAHVLAFPFLYRMLGGDAPAFAVVVTTLSAAFWGVRGGLLCAVTISLLIVLQLDMLERLSGVAEMYRQGTPGALTLVLVGATVGRLRDLRETVRRELTRRREAEAAAAAANRAKSQFLSRMSHELRTPLNSILGFAQLLEMDPLSPEQHESVGHILRSGEHLLALVNEVLDISRIEAGHLTIAREPVPVGAVLREAVDMIRPLAAAGAVHLYDTASATAWTVQADRHRVKQIMVNLLSNAVKFNHNGGTVTLTCSELPGHRLRLAVRDTGRGIPAAEMSRVFVPFARPGAETAGVEGVGIGLAISKALAGLMEGSVGVDSVVGEGSTFWLDLPLADADATAGSALPVAAPRATGGEARLPVVLCVDGNLGDLELLKSLVTGRFRVRLATAASASSGLELAARQPPDLILLGTDLPDLTGEEMLYRLKALPSSAAIPVVMIGAEASSGQIERLLAQGVREYIPKPVNVRQLVKVLEGGLALRGDGHKDAESDDDHGPAERA